MKNMMGYLEPTLSSHIAYEFANICQNCMKLSEFESLKRTVEQLQADAEEKKSIIEQLKRDIELIKTQKQECEKKNDKLVARSTLCQLMRKTLSLIYNHFTSVDITFHSPRPFENQTTELEPQLKQWLQDLSLADTSSTSYDLTQTIREPIDAHDMNYVAHAKEHADHQ